MKSVLTVRLKGDFFLFLPFFPYFFLSSNGINYITLVDLLSSNSNFRFGSLLIVPVPVRLISRPNGTPYRGSFCADTIRYDSIAPFSFHSTPLGELGTLYVCMCVLYHFIAGR